MKLHIQPDDGIEPLLSALRKAEKSIHILVFRFDRTEIEDELLAAVKRGVNVHALIAFANHGEAKELRKLELRLLEHGVTVARTSDDLIRYHGKMFITDHKRLYLLAFNYTYLDINMSRSFAIETHDEKLVHEAMRLFHADTRRQPYRAEHDDFVVSPVNARERLMHFIGGAKKHLLMYEMKVSDHDFTALLNRKIAEGVDVRILGSTGAKSKLPSRKLPFRLHARAIMRDGKSAFLGSQSLRRLEMEARREIGVIVHDHKIVEQMEEVFEKDWQASLAPETHGDDSFLDLPAKIVAKAVAKKVDLLPMVAESIREAMHDAQATPMDPEQITEALQHAFRGEVREAVADVVKEMMHPGAAATDVDPIREG